MSDLPEPSIATIRVDYSLILLSSGTDGVTPSATELKESNGLIVVTHGGAAIITGIGSGTVEVSVELVDGEPKGGLGEWEEMVDVSIDASAGDLRVTTVLGDVPDLPALSAKGPGLYRVRCLAKGRELHPSGVEIESAERYRLIAWPAPGSPPIDHRVLPSKFSR